MNIAGNLERSASIFPARPAVSEGLNEISYAQLDDHSNRVATALMEMGVKPGDHVCLCAQFKRVARLFLRFNQGRGRRRNTVKLTET